MGTGTGGGGGGQRGTVSRSRFCTGQDTKIEESLLLTLGRVELPATLGHVVEIQNDISHSNYKKEG